jgi:hypothetical protein
VLSLVAGSAIAPGRPLCWPITGKEDTISRNRRQLAIKILALFSFFKKITLLGKVSGLAFIK